MESVMKWATEHPFLFTFILLAFFNAVGEAVKFLNRSK